MIGYIHKGVITFGRVTSYSQNNIYLALQQKYGINLVVN